MFSHALTFNSEVSGIYCCWWFLWTNTLVFTSDTCLYKWPWMSETSYGYYLKHFLKSCVYRSWCFVQIIFGLGLKTTYFDNIAPYFSRTSVTFLCMINEGEEEDGGTCINKW